MDDQLNQKLASYKSTPEATALVRSTKILFLVGISGAGKDTIKNRLLAKPGYHHIVSHTTRNPRVNEGVLEQDGVDYHFISMDEASKMLDAGAYIEAKMYSDNIYGTSVAEIQKAHDQGAVAVTDLEVQGVVEYKVIAPQVTAVFVLPPSYEVWQKRLMQRYAGHEVNKADLEKRLRTARDELQHALETDYFHFVINDDLAATVAEIDHIAHNQLAPKREQHAHELAESILAGLEDNL